MHRAVPFQLRRFHASGMRISFVVLAALLFSAFFHCMCGPSCKTYLGTLDYNAPVVAENSCCSSCSPAQESENQDPDQKSCTCCLIKLPDYEPVVYADHVNIPEGITRIEDYPAPQPATLYTPPHHLQPEALSAGPPIFLRFEILLI